MTTLTAHFDLPLDANAPGWARGAVSSLLNGWGLADPEWSDAALTVISELVSNAVRHGGGQLVVEVEAHGRLVTLSVADGSSVLPARRSPDGTGGLGLRIIEAMTTRWYVESHEGGKRVRAELPACPGEDEDAGGSGRTEESA
jgi:anti-sigma regulatory factor (Ser/Thr protein kinase)